MLILFLLHFELFTIELCIISSKQFQDELGMCLWNSNSMKEKRKTKQQKTEITMVC